MTLVVSVARVKQRRQRQRPSRRTTTASSSGQAKWHSIQESMHALLTGEPSGRQTAAAGRTAGSAVAGPERREGGNGHHGGSPRGIPRSDRTAGAGPHIRASPQISLKFL